LAERLRLLVDVDVVMDVLAARVPYLEHAAEVWHAVETGRVEGLIAAHTATTLHYLLTRQRDRATAGAALADLLRVFEVAAVDGDVLDRALAMGWNDFEDAVQVAAALAAGATHVVTRNTPDYRSAPISVLQPSELSALLSSTADTE
jgi:predicted nucleic acid-binding protein